MSYQKNIFFLSVFVTLLFSSTNITIGADIGYPSKSTKSDNKVKFTKYVSVNGKGNKCTRQHPCGIYTLVDMIVPGDIVAFEEGVYYMDKRLNIHKSHSGTKKKPIILMPLPGKKVIFDGNQTIKKIQKEPKYITILSRADYIMFRNFEIRHMSRSGLMIGGSYNVVENCHIHHNFFGGIEIFDTDRFDKTPYDNGYNIIQNNLIHDNSDANLTSATYKNGGSSDGISITSGKFNKVVHNTIYGNSDDGIDTWHSNDTEVAYNLVYQNGIADGDGNGIKSGGNLDRNATNGQRAYVHHNISFNNRAFGFDLNAGKEVVWEFNTAYKNGKAGYGNLVKGDVVLRNNLAIENSEQENSQFKQHNSWQYSQLIKVISKDMYSTDFLRPDKGTIYQNMGVYAH